MKRKAFVTGGTGFIGINLIKLLLRSGWEITALHRPNSDLTYLNKLPLQLKKGSITELESLKKAVPANTNTVFHLAGDTNLWSKHNKRQTLINVKGTRNILEAALSKGVKNFIFTSSASVWSDMTNKHISENLPQKGDQSWVNYEKTKWAAEQEVIKHSESEMKVVILNPTTVTGPYDLNNWGRLFIALKEDKLPGIPGGEISVAHVHEVAKAHLNAVDKGKNANNYILSGEDCTLVSFITEIARVSGKRKVPRKIPDTVLKILARYQTFQSFFTGKKPDLTPELVKLMTRKNISYSSQKALDELGYKIIPMKQSVKDCYEWLKSEGFL